MAKAMAIVSNDYIKQPNKAKAGPPPGGRCSRTPKISGLVAAGHNKSEHA